MRISRIIVSALEMEFEYTLNLMRDREFQWDQYGFPWNKLEGEKKHILEYSESRGHFDTE